MTPRILGAARLAPVLLASSALVAGSLGLATPAQADTTYSVTVTVPVPEGATSVEGLHASLICAGKPDPENGEADPEGTKYCMDPEERIQGTVHNGTATLSGLTDHTAYIINVYDTRNGADVDSYSSPRFVVDGSDTTTSVETFLMQNRCTSLPTVTGTPAVGQQLTASGASFAYFYYLDQDEVSGSTDVTNEDGTLTYQWEHVFEDDPAYGDPITGPDGEPVTGTHYTVTADDAGAQVRARAVFQANSYKHPAVECYSADAKSIPAAATPTPTPAPVIAPGTPIPGASTPAVTGKVKKGKTVSAGVSVPAGATASYQWYRTFKKGKRTVTQLIPGATADTYKPTGKDVGKKIFVIVTYSSPGYSATTLISATKKVK